MSHALGVSDTTRTTTPTDVRRGKFGPNDHPAWGHDRTSEWLGVTITEYAPGYAKGHMQVREEMLNGFNIAHGGMVFALADSIFAWTCNNPDGDGSTITVAQGADINFVSSPQIGTILTATGFLRASTGRSGLYDITVVDDQGNLVAEFRGRSRTIPNPSR
ncbi:hotdog fold thioesterase [Enteractinococcus helveticum]|uniref:hotdog fold thioesterase n=1 Tax=Enteractinococcus helveticum TaxID=1837282 RepID=UPI0009EDEA09|nr:hotdog fold thioesterase [Enteractinococcus helveticum]